MRCIISIIIIISRDAVFARNDALCSWDMDSFSPTKCVPGGWEAVDPSSRV